MNVQVPIVAGATELDLDPQIESRPRKLPPRRGGRMYMVSTVTAQICALARYTVLARVLGPTELGLAATLILTVSFFELISDTGSDRFLIQNRDAEDPDAQKLTHYVAVTRGFLIGAVLILFAAQLAALFNSRALTMGFVALAAYPVIFGFRHLDYRRFQRDNDFRAESWVSLLGEVGSLLGTVIATFVMRSFAAIVVGFIVRALIMVVVSHVMASRPYRVGMARQHGPALRRFALPLMANGVLMFAGMQGDRVMTAHLVGVKELGQYSAALLMIFYPLSFIQRWLAGTSFPQIAAAQHHPENFDSVADNIAAKTVLIGVTVAAGYALVGSLACTLIYGAKFSQPAWLIGLIAMFQMFRFARVWPTNIALGAGKSGVVLANNIFRLSAIPLALVGVSMFDHLGAVVGAYAIGENIALVAALLLVNRARGRPLFQDFDRALMLWLVCADIIAFNMALLMRSPLIAVTATAMTFATLYWIARRDRALLRWLWKTGMRRLRPAAA